MKDLRGLTVEQSKYRIRGYIHVISGLLWLMSTHLSSVNEYHKTYYHPHNLQLIVTGKVDPTALLNALNDDVEPSLIKHGQDHIPGGWKRPFLETASKGGAVLTESKTVEVKFPAKHESIGEVQISWVGPKFNTNVRNSQILEPQTSPNPTRHPFFFFLETREAVVNDMIFQNVGIINLVCFGHSGGIPY